MEVKPEIERGGGEGTRGSTMGETRSGIGGSKLKERERAKPLKK